MPGILSQLAAAESDPLAPKSPHFPAKAKNVIFLFMTGGVSHVDTFDPKPNLTRDVGKEVKLDARPIEIYELVLNKFEYPDFEIRIRCGSGTYVRSIGRDLGRRLGSGAIMTGLERTAIGEFNVASGIGPGDLTLELIKTHLILPQAGLPQMPRIEVPDGQAEKFANGHTWSTSAPMPADEIVLPLPGALTDEAEELHGCADTEEVEAPPLAPDYLDQSALKDVSDR